jgi:hypothetical protein
MACSKIVGYDNIQRALLTSGQLARYIDEYAVSGVTSNWPALTSMLDGSIMTPLHALQDAGQGVWSQPTRWLAPLVNRTTASLFPRR